MRATRRGSMASCAQPCRQPKRIGVQRRDGRGLHGPARFAHREGEEEEPEPVDEPAPDEPDPPEAPPVAPVLPAPDDEPWPEDMPAPCIRLPDGLIIMKTVLPSCVRAGGRRRWGLPPPACSPRQRWSRIPSPQPRSRPYSATRSRS